MALINYEEQPIRLRPPTPGGLNDPAALGGVANGLSVIGDNTAPSIRSAFTQAGQDFAQRAGAGDYAGAAGSTLRSMGSMAGAAANDLLLRPSRQIASAFGGGPEQAAPAGSRFMSGLTGAPPAIQDQGQVRKFDNGLAAAGAPLAAAGGVPTPPPVTQPPVVAPTATAPANGGRPFALGSPQDTAFQSANLRANGGAQGPGPSMSVIDSGADARQSFFDNANLRTAAARTNFSPRKGYTANDSAIQAAAIPIQERAKLRELSLKNEGDRSIATMRDATDRRGQDITARTAEGAQDVTLRGQDMTAKTAANVARVDQMNKDRQFGLDVQKYGQDVAKTNFEQRQKAVKDVTDQVAGMLPPGADGKPDTAAAARYASALNTHVAQRQEQLRAQLAKTPDRADVKAELAALDERGLAAMDQSAIRKLIVGQQAAELAAQTGTSRFNPIGTSAANSTAPITSLREQKGLFGSDYISDRGDVIPGRYLRNNGQQNQDLNTLIQR